IPLSARSLHVWFPACGAVDRLPGVMDMSKNPTEKELVERVGVAVRRMGAQSVLNSDVIASMFGLHKTDLESLDLLYLRGGACSAGELSKATGLSSGSPT